MTTAPHPVPAQIGRLESRALVVGGVGLAACAVGLLVEPTQFFRSYLYGFLFWIGVAIGCMSIAMIHHMSGGLWGLAIRRILEAGTRTFKYAWLLFVPLAFGLPKIYEWAQPDKVAHDELLQHKHLYLNTGFFVGRAVFYFAVWIGLAHFMNKWSAELDEKAGDRTLSRRLRGLSGGGLVLMGLTITFSAVDWAMSLDAHWFSTIYGVLFMIGQALSAMALVIALLAALGSEEPLARIVSPQVFHDLGKLLFAFVMFWAYIALSQFLIIWSGNLPEEIPWYLHRLRGGWQYVALVIVLLHFVLPFLLLLSRDLKRNPRLIGLVAMGVFAVRLVDLYWLVAPEFHGGFSVHWLDVAAPVGIGGIWLWAFSRNLKERSLLPWGDPELRELLGPGH